MAENKYGTSDPAMTQDPIKARHPFGKYSCYNEKILGENLGT